MPLLSITLLIIVATSLTSLLAFGSRETMDKLIMRPYAVKHHKEYYRFLSSGFIHANWPHLILNMLVLWSFGRVVEYYYREVFGPMAITYFLLLYLLGMIVADIPTYLKHLNHPAYGSLGAS